MPSQELELDSINDTLNPAPPRFGMPWYVIMGILILSVIFICIPNKSCKICGFCFCPLCLGFGWWLCKDDPKEPLLILHDVALPSEFDPGK